MSRKPSYDAIIENNVGAAPISRNKPGGWLDFEIIAFGAFGGSDLGSTNCDHGDTDAST